MAESVQSPGVNISQVVNETPVVAQTPTLAPCVVGPCFEVMEASVEGAVNANAKVDGLSYRQFPVVIPTSTFPTNNTTTDELVFQNGSIDALLTRSFGGSTSIVNLEEGATGSSFLSSINIATRPCLILNHTKIVVAQGSWPAVEIYFKANKSLPVKVSMAADSDAATVTDSFVAAGFDASVLIADGTENTLTDVGDELIVVTLSNRSANYGAQSSISMVRYADQIGAGANYNKIANLANDALVDIRVEGSGIAVSSSDSSSITLNSGTMYTGDFRGVNGYTGLSVADWTVRDGAQNAARTIYAGLLTGDISADNLIVESTNTSVPTLSSLSVEGSSASNNGDLLYLDGVNVGQLSNISDSSAKVVLVDPNASRYGADGDIIFQRYVPADLSGLTPRYAYIVAQNLSTPGSAATHTIDVSGAGGFTAASKASINLIAADLDVLGNLPALLLQDTELHVRVDINGVIGDVQVVQFDANYDGDAGMVALSTILNDNLTGVVAEVQAGSVRLLASEAGAHITINVLSAVQGSTANVMFKDAQGSFLTADASFTSTGTDAIIAGLAGTDVSIFFDYNPLAVTVNAFDNTIAGLANQINDAVFSTVAVFDQNNSELVITSGTKGITSQLILPVNNSINVPAQVTKTGTGRPSRDLMVDSSGTLHIGGQIFRSSLTGEPLPWNSLGQVDVHVSYKALRLDVSTSPVNSDAGLIKVSSISDLAANFGPINDSNPLGLGLYYALLNTGLDGTEVSAIGINEVTASSPEGTAASYGEALTLISGHEVYAIAPLTSDESIISAFDKHVTSLSQAENRAERILISGPKIPTLEESTLIASGSNAQSVRIMNTIQLDGSHIDAVSAYIDGNANPIPESDGLFIDITINGELRKYSIQRMSGSNIVIRTNASNSLFSSTPIYLTDEFEALSYSIGILGSSLNIPGTSLLDGSRFATTVRNSARAFANKRHIRIFPGNVVSSIDGLEKIIPSYYYAAAIAGDCASRPPQQPLTRSALAGFTGVSGPALSNSQLDTIAAGNLVLVSETPGSVPIVRMQCTTDADALENRELSIVKAIDTFAKRLRKSLIGRVGSNNITQAYMDSTSLMIGSICDSAVRSGLLANASLSALSQDPVQRDTLIVEVNVAVLYPANYIKLSIVI